MITCDYMFLIALQWHLHTYVAYERVRPLSRQRGCMRWPQRKKSPSWNILVTVPIELLTRVTLLNSSCWDSKPISRTSLRAPHSPATDPAVRQCRTSQVTDGRGITTERQKCLLAFDFSRHQVLFVAHKEWRLPLVLDKGMGPRGSLCGCIHWS